MLSASSGVDRLLAPRHGPGVCSRCLNLTAEATGLCRACRAGEHHLAAVVPISYSVGGEWLHHLIASYKRDADPWVPDATATLARICEAFLTAHERCVAISAGVERFELVATVPSGDSGRDAHHPLRRIVGDLIAPTRDRHERLLVRNRIPAIPRQFDAARYRVTRQLRGEAVLLIDDMWTSGTSAQSAAAALLDAGAGKVAAVVIARHLNRGWDRNDLRLRRLARDGFDFTSCAVCSSSDALLTTKPAVAQRGGGGLSSLRR
jgi:predicted amidophosphoribosyltransferase